MTKEDEAAFLEKRVEGIRQHLPMSPEEFEDEVDELTWKWARHLLPYVDLQRHDLASHKRRTVLKQREFFETIRLFKPLALKYPTLLKRFRTGYPNIENINMAINVPWIQNEENIAGFTYEDLAAETNGGSYTSWETFKVDDLVHGIVVSIADLGAFIEIGAKTWAFMPTANCSLAPIATPAEVLKLGDEVDAKIVKIGFESQIPGDPKASQIVLSMTELQRIKAWDEIDAILKGEEGTEQVFQVLVKQIRPFGAIVQTQSGLEGLIPNAELSDRAGDSSLVGQTISVALLSGRRDSMGTANPLRPFDFALTFSYKNTATKELAQELQEGMLVRGKVAGIRVSSIDVDVRIDVGGLRATRCTIRKVDVSSKPVADLSEVFALGEEIVAYVLLTDQKTGEIRLSTRAIEPKRGMMLDRKGEVFARAEETAKIYFERSLQEKIEKQKILGEALGDMDVDVLVKRRETTKKPGPVDIEGELGDSDGGF